MQKKEKLLFVCTAGMQRSVTAAELVAEAAPERFEAHAVGISPFAAMRITQGDIDWADRIFVMSEREDGHLSFITKHFELGGKPVAVLGIADRYVRGDETLVALLSHALAQHLDISFTNGD